MTPTIGRKFPFFGPGFSDSSGTSGPSTDRLTPGRVPGDEVGREVAVSFFVSAPVVYRYIRDERVETWNCFRREASRRTRYKSLDHCLRGAYSYHTN